MKHFARPDREERRDKRKEKGSSEAGDEGIEGMVREYQNDPGMSGSGSYVGAGGGVEREKGETKTGSEGGKPARRGCVWRKETRMLNSAGPWIGAVELGESNQFVWYSTNTSVGLGDWIHGQPNSRAFGDGVVMACEFRYEWMDKQQNTKLPFLCEMTPKATCPSQFTPIGDSCYYFGTSTMPWDTAQEVCRTLAPNGKLVEMETAE
ncbi:unnamed protein product, partial [Cyprideis torosa]